MEELELHCRRRGRSNFRKIKIATISVRMVSVIVSDPECWNSSCLVMKITARIVMCIAFSADQPLAIEFIKQFFARH